MPVFRKKIIAGNWKMNKTASEALELTKDILSELNQLNGVDVVLCPPFTALAIVSEKLNDTPNIRLGAQNLYKKTHGAYTGEVSGPMLRDLYCRYVIIGHSERRQLFGETNALIHEKIKAALESRIKPILCIGETLPEREADQWKSILETQLHEALTSLTEKQMAEIVLAYEPVWAIGTGQTATPEIAQETHAYLRHLLESIFGKTIASKTRIQYGGSVKPDNAATLLHQPDIDGALVGGASLDARSFASIVKSACPRETLN